MVCRGAQKTRVLHRASCVSPQISLASARNIHHPVSVRFFTPSDPLFSMPLQYLGLCSLAFRSRTFERGTRFDMYLRRHDYIHLPLYYTFTITMIAACTDTRMGRSSIGRVASWFLFIASFRNKIASNYSVGFTGIYLRRVRITDSWICGGWWPREVAKSVESERLSSFILSWN